MNNYSQYPTWQEQDGELVPVCEKPELKNYNSKLQFQDTLRYENDMRAYNESLKISLQIIGDKDSIKGGKDLKIDVDFKIEYQLRRSFINQMEWNTVDPQKYENYQSEKRIVAVLIDNKQSNNMVQVVCEHHEYTSAFYTDTAGNEYGLTQCKICGKTLDNKQKDYIPVGSTEWLRQSEGQYVPAGQEDTIAEYLEKYRYEEAMTSHRLARNILKQFKELPKQLEEVKGTYESELIRVTLIQNRGSDKYKEMLTFFSGNDYNFATQPVIEEVNEDAISPDDLIKKYLNKAGLPHLLNHNNANHRLRKAILNMLQEYKHSKS